MKREKHVANLKEGNFDLLVIGGGATGSGIALDAATRGLKVALLEKNDFSSGTSSRSTKLVHGGVRYLEQAIKKLDRGQYQLVKDALYERKTLLKIAPHLSRPLGILTPLYKWYQAPYLRFGFKMYDWLAGKRNLKPSRFVWRKKTLATFPFFRKKRLKGGILYFDGQFDDARMNISILKTAATKGATVANYVEVEKLIKNDAGNLCGVVAHDKIGPQFFEVYAKAIINATGPFVDTLRRMDDPDASPMLSVSSGIHIVLDKKFLPLDTGILIPKTEDGRVLFLLPWLEHTLVGTTDNLSTLSENPAASEEEIAYILRHLEKYFDILVSRQDVLSAWSGLRPLVSDPSKVDTAKLSRDHVINRSDSGLITISGGKWTTYRRMAEDALNEAINYAGLTPKNGSVTEDTMLVGGENFYLGLTDELKEEFKLAPDIAKHLVRSYGDRARYLLETYGEKYPERLVSNHPFIEAEVPYALFEEAACTASDILSRRMRLAFLDLEAAEKALPRVIEIMAHVSNLPQDHYEQREASHTSFFA